MGKAWKRFNHRQRTWGAKQEAPAAPPAPETKVAQPATPPAQPKTKTTSIPKRTKPKATSTKKK